MIIIELSFTISDQPIITLEPEVERTEGMELSISCNVNANPAVAPVTWAKLDATYRSTGIESNDTTPGVSTITFDSATREDAGIYSCRSSNSVGEMTKSVKVYIYCKCVVPIIINPKH